MEAANSMPSASTRASSNQSSEPAIQNNHRSLALAILVAGFLARFWQARSYFLNPDEALHNLLASQNSLAATYSASLTTAHPPLLIVLLHYWRWFGQSELVLRLPSALAGVACCWLMYLWLEQIADRSTALVGLILMSFTPALIELSAEVRQYAFLMFFMAAGLYLSDRAIRESSPGLMALFSLSLYAAILSHYSALLFALAIGVYMLMRLRRAGKRGLFVVWACGQLLALVLTAFLLTTQVAHLKQSGAAQEIAGTYLRRSIYHPGENNLFLFPWRQTLWVFTYLFSHGFLGTLALLAFLAGIISLLRQKSSSPENPTGGELVWLLVLPFVANCAVAIAGLYPYGGSRHNSYLALFAISGVAVGIASCKPPQTWRRAVVILLCLAICNFFPAPPPLIRARNHRRDLMIEAVAFLRRSAPPGSALFTDYQSGLLLGYYACKHGVVLLGQTSSHFVRTDCGPYSVITTSLQKWNSAPNVLTGEVTGAAKTYGIAPGTHLWLFNAGWILDSAPEIRKELPQLGCTAPQNFGENIQVCELTVPGNEIEIPIQKR